MMIKNVLTKTALFGMLAAGLIGCTKSAEITESTSLVPADPTGLTVGTTTGTAITVSWTDNATNETAYVVEKCVGSGCTSYAAVSSSPFAANTTSYTQTGLTVSTTYRFRVKATNSFGSSSYLTGTNITTSSSTAASSNMCTSPVTQVVDYGTRNTAGTTLAVRGAYSSMALKPGTTYPAVAFGETQTVGPTSLKFMYWDGTKFNYETVMSGQTPTYIKLVYLSTGIPLIFWGNGTYLYGAARSTASTSTEGTWTVLALDTSSTAIRGVDAAVNPDNEVSLFFVTNTAAASSHKAILCQSSCATMSATNYPAATVIEATNSATNTYAVGAAWCYSGAQYYPMFFYPAAATFRLATCRASDLSTCTGAAWLTGTVGPANANRVAASMNVDATATDASVYMIGADAGGITPFVMTNCSTAVQAAAWPGQTTGTTMGAATTGTAWIALAKDALNNFHVVANEALVSIRTFSATTAGFVGGAWSAAASTNWVETTGAAGLPAVGATRGGIVVDNTNDQLLINYGRTAVLSPVTTWGNVVIAFNECPSGVGAPACSTTTLGSVAASTGMWWGNMPADTSGQIQKPSLGYPNISTAVTSTGIPAMAYVDYSVGATADPVIGARLKYAYRDGSLTTSTWKVAIINGQNSSPQSPSLAFDENNLPWIAWNETASATVQQKFFLATNTRTDGQGTWTIYNFPAFYGLVAAGTYPTMSQAVVAMYEVAGVRKPVVIVMSSLAAAAAREVRAALFNPTTKLWSNVKQVATIAGTATIGGAFLSTDWDSSGNIVFAFNDMSTGAGQVNCTGTTRCIRMYYTTDGGATWTGTTTSGVINSATYEAAKIRLNPSNNRPAIAFMDRAANQLRYKYCTTALASCTSSANWLDLGVGIIDATLGISGLTEAANLGQFDTGFTFTADGLPWVVYPRGSTVTTYPNLMFSNVSTSAGLFGASTTLYAPPGNGILTLPAAATANNFALSWNPSSARSTYTGSLHTGFIGHGNFLYITSCGD